jgi:hypothetical protein
MSTSSVTSNVTRICPHCGHANLLDARHCASCGGDYDAALPVAQATNLPAVIGKAAVPVLLGAAGLAVSAGIKLLQAVLHKPAAAPLAAKRGDAGPPAPRARMTITVRTSWAVGDSSGRWEKGQSEQTIELGD